MNKKRLKKVSDTNDRTALRKKRIIRTKEKMLLKKELELKEKRKVTVKTKATSKQTPVKSGGCGGCRRKKKNG